MVSELEDSVGRIIQALGRHLDKQGEGVRVNIEDLMDRFMIDVSLSCLYKQYNLVNFDLDQKCEWTDTIQRGFHELHSNSIFRLGFVVPPIRRFVDFFIFHFHPLGKWRRDIMQFLKSQARIGFEARKQLEEMKRDPEFKNGDKFDEDNFILKDGTKFSRNLVDYIVDQFYAGKLTRGEYFNSSAFLFGASHKTASDALAFSLYQLGRNQDCQNKLRESLKKEGADSEYLGWVINESLRMYPPVSAGAHRMLETDLAIDSVPGGVVIKKGAFINTPLYTIHRLKKYWGDDADEFRPERWARQADFHPCQYMPFGAGLRTCLGKEFALHMIRMMLSSLISQFRFDCPEPKADLNEFSSPITIFLLQKTPFYAQVSHVVEE